MSWYVSSFLLFTVYLTAWVLQSHVFSGKSPAHTPRGAPAAPLLPLPGGAAAAGTGFDTHTHTTHPSARALRLEHPGAVLHGGVKDGHVAEIDKSHVPSWRPPVLERVRKELHAHTREMPTSRNEEPALGTTRVYMALHHLPVPCIHHQVELVRQHWEEV